MNKFDELTIKTYESELLERVELRARKHWLLLHHTEFQKELREVEQDAGKTLPLGLHPEFSNDSRGMMLPYWHALDYERNLSEFYNDGTSGQAFISKYDLFPDNDLSWALAKLRKVAKDGHWYSYQNDKDTFWRDAEWYDLKLKNNDTEILEKSIKRDVVSFDIGALDYWKNKDEVKDKALFERLCKFAKVVPTEREKSGKKWLEISKSDKLKLLYYLGRFNLGISKGNLGWPATQYPPFDGGSEELQTGRKYLIHIDYEWPIQLFTREESTFICSQIRDSYIDWRTDYLSSECYESQRSKIRKARFSLKKKIDQLYVSYQKS